MERGFLWIVLVIQFTMTLATSSLSAATSSPTPSVSTLESSSSSSISSSSTSTAQMTDSGGSSIISASSAVSASSTMQQTATVLSHSTTASTSSVNTTQGAITNSTAAEETLSTNLKTSQPTSTYSQNLTWSPSPSFICTSWFAKQEDCSKTCSNAGGTVKKTCKCSSNSVAISESVCENYGIKTTDMGKCKNLCPASGTNALGSLSRIVAVQCSLLMFILFT
ncbi:PREDICTED: cell wall integrity and stress response component 2-like isoform X10 [Acropora digitifera]|uniref:cell wall integrity and stress response component 2-like isoform X10 n=1 Tax=Acropora digitifera TaxID=70779 RepID=UPI00077AEB7C|nr:PREDICTED: cell wall integrity and stress response component 2-like isoform X10 [Acropora digitifera]